MPAKPKKKLQKKKPANKKLFIDLGSGLAGKFRFLAQRSAGKKRLYEFLLVEKPGGKIRHPGKLNPNLRASHEGALNSLKKLEKNSVHWINSDFFIFTSAVSRFKIREKSVKILGEIKRVLKPGGRISISVREEDVSFVKTGLENAGFGFIRSQKVKKSSKIKSHWENVYMRLSTQKKEAFAWPYRITARK